MKINPLLHKDIPKLAGIARQSFHDTYSWGNPKQDMENYMDKYFSEEQLLKEFSNPHSAFYFLTEKGQIQGYLKVNIKDAQTDQILENALEIERIYILKAAQSKGFGKELLAFSIHLAKAKNKQFVWLGVWEHNPKAIAFYQKNGFEVMGTHDFHFGGVAQTDYVMKLKL